MGLREQADKLAFLHSIPKAIVASAIILAFAIIVSAGMLSGSYEIAGDHNLIYRLDRHTGMITACVVDQTAWDENENRAGMKVHCDVPAK